MNKKLCPIHHLYYKGIECPLCFEERVKVMEAKFMSHKDAVKKEPNIVTFDMLDKLKEKFNTK